MLNTGRIHKDDGINWYFFQRGRDALYSYLAKINKEEPLKNEVILPAISCVAVVQIIRVLGLKPIYIDLDSQDLNFDKNLLDSKVSSSTLAIIHHGFYGYIPQEIFTSNKCKNILDLAQGNLLDFELPRSVDMAFMSCQWNKQIAFGLGALMMTRDLCEFKLKSKKKPFYKMSSLIISTLKSLNLYQHFFKMVHCVKGEDEKAKPLSHYTPIGLTSKQRDSLSAYINSLGKIDLSNIVEYLEQNNLIYFKSSSDLGEVKIVLISDYKEKLKGQDRIFLYPWPKTNLSPCENLEQWNLKKSDYPVADLVIKESLVLTFRDKNTMMKNFEFIKNNLSEFKKHG